MLVYTHSHMNEAGFRILFDTYRNRIYGYTLAISHSEYIAEEITQEIFIKLWVCRDMIHDIENLDAYIFTMARNKTLNHLRKAATDQKLLKELQSHMVPQNNTTEEHAMLSECHSQVHQALTMLSPQRRLVYHLSRAQGLNHQEIASHLRLSRNTVKNHMVEALRFLKKYLAGH